ncbi:LysR family transcriptional regulator [Numidum massiliense]|uniref:LysR family transcriptional regulator n=1 Tax=Numidum massiliense TaxID=1522315 RepID=UPI0006D52ECF|nr:LysR family transcriptional regulator [Numidum massiliense]
MRTEWFAAFIAAAKWKSFSKASEQCHLTQPALAKQIKRLEEALGTELFVRSSKGVALTKTGELAFQRLQPVLAEIKAIQRDINACTKKAKVTLGTLASLATYYLPPKMTAIPEDELDVELVIGESSLGVFTMLQEGGVDAAVIDVGAMRHDYWVADLFTEPYRVIVPQGHRLSKYQSIAVTDLRDESWVLYPHECESRRFLEHLYAAHGLSLTVARSAVIGNAMLPYVRCDFPKATLTCK